MKDEIYDAPGSIRRMSIKLGDIVYIWVGGQVDEIARERYVAEKRRLNRVKRRRGLLPLPVFGEHTAGHGMPGTAATVVGGGALAVGIAAAAILPITLGDGHKPAHRPSAAAPAPTMPGPPERIHPPAPSPPARPQTPPRSAAPSNAPALPGLHVVAAPVSAPARIPGIPKLHIRPPGLPEPPPVRIPPPPMKHQPTPLTVSLRPVGLTVRLSPHPMIHVRIGPASH